MQVSKNTVRKPAGSQLMSIEEYFAAKGLSIAGKKPVLTLVPKSSPSPAALVAMALANLRNGIICRNSRLMETDGYHFSDDIESIPTNATSGNREPMLARGEERNGRQHVRRSIGIGKRKPIEVVLYRKNKQGEWNYETVQMAQCESYVVTYPVKQSKKPKYKNVPRGENLTNVGHFRVKHTRTQTGDLVA